MNENNKLKIGIVTPIHEDDIKYLGYNKKCVQDLKPKAFAHLSYINNGSKGLKYYRTFLFDSIFFYSSCDIALQCSIDHYLFKDILSLVDENKVTTFAYFKRKLSFIIDFIRFKVSPSMWTGCYSITRKFWELIRMDGSFDGSDYSIMKFAEKINYPIKRVRRPSYFLLNPSKSDPFKNIENYPLWKKIIRKIGWINHGF